jgi:hypothetical protein
VVDNGDRDLAIADEMATVVACVPLKDGDSGADDGRSRSPLRGASAPRLRVGVVRPSTVRSWASRNPVQRRNTWLQVPYYRLLGNVVIRESQHRAGELY